jgi:DNA-binding transcriptional LysR family regulator
MAGAGVSLLPTAILPRRRGAGSLRILHAQPRLGRPRLFAAYQIEKAGRRVEAVLDTVRRVIAASNLVATSG